MPSPFRAVLYAFVFAWLSLPASAAPVVLISIDGLRPADVLDAGQRGLKIPNLRDFLREGSYASGVRGVLPTLTYPSHTTILTGVAPARHGIASNLTFDPLWKNQQGWYWYANDIRVPTLWDAARAAGLTTANVHWPVSVGAPVDMNLPQIWRTGHDDDRKLLAALSTPGVLPSLEATLGPYAQGIDESIEADESRARFALRLLATRKPGFMTVYLTALDHEQHNAGVDTPSAHAVLERIDALVGQLVATAQKADPLSVIAVVSDHGFAPLAHDVNLYGAFIKARLITLDDKGKVSAWEATPWYASGSAPIMLREPGNANVRARVKAVLDPLAADAANGIDRVLDKAAIAKFGGTPDADFFVVFKPGHEIGADPTAAQISPSKLRGMHGYAPDIAAMKATFLLRGRGIPPAHALGEIDMRDIAPTLGKVLGVRLPTADGKALLP
ncbi:MAG: ectonucleotide pyrophosphatase/phosphodiesterase [Dokdonella sp.]